MGKYHTNAQGKIVMRRNPSKQKAADGFEDYFDDTIDDFKNVFPPEIDDNDDLIVKKLRSELSHFLTMLGYSPDELNWDIITLDDMSQLTDLCVSELLQLSLDQAKKRKMIH